MPAWWEKLVSTSEAFSQLMDRVWWNGHHLAQDRMLFYTGMVVAFCVYFYSIIPTDWPILMEKVSFRLGINTPFDTCMMRAVSFHFRGILLPDWHIFMKPALFGSGRDAFQQGHGRSIVCPLLKHFANWLTNFDETGIISIRIGCFLTRAW